MVPARSCTVYEKLLEGQAQQTGQDAPVAQAKTGRNFMLFAVCCLNDGIFGIGRCLKKGVVVDFVFFLFCGVCLCFC